MASVIGYYCALYYNDGTSGSPSWLEIETVRDVTLDLTRNDVDDTSRTTEGWRSRLAGLAEWGLDFEMVYNTASTSWQKVRKSFFDNTVIEVLALDGPITVDGQQGIRGNVFVTGLPREEPLEDVVSNSGTLVGNGTPTWVVSSGGVVVPLDGS